MKAILQSDGSLALSDAHQTRVIRPDHPAHPGLMRLYGAHAPVALSAATFAPPTLGSSAAPPLHGADAGAESEHAFPPGYGGHPWTKTGTPANRIYYVPVENLRRDPARFPAKNAADDGDLDSGGVLAVWKDAGDGQTYVITGQARVAAAKRAGDEPGLPCRYLTAKNAAEAWAIGAIIALARGTGTAADAARFFRDTGCTVADLQKLGVRITGRVAFEGAILAFLPETLLVLVETGKLTRDQAAAIANGLPASKHEAFARYVAMQTERGRPLSTATIDAMIQRFNESNERKNHAERTKADEAIHRGAVGEDVQGSDGARSDGGADAGGESAGGGSRHQTEPAGLTPRGRDHWTIWPHGDGFGLFRHGRSTPVATASTQAELLDHIHGRGRSRYLPPIRLSAAHVTGDVYMRQTTGNDRGIEIVSGGQVAMFLPMVAGADITSLHRKAVKLVEAFRAKGVPAPQPVAMSAAKSDEDEEAIYQHYLLLFTRIFAEEDTTRVIQPSPLPTALSSRTAPTERPARAKRPVTGLPPMTRAEARAHVERLTPPGTSREVRDAALKSTVAKFC